MQEHRLEDVKAYSDEHSSENQLDEDDARYQEVELSLKRKFDWCITPCFMVMYFLTNIDRANVGSAIIMNKALGHDLQSVTHMTGSQISLGVALFYVGFVIFELPSNLMLTKVPASKWLSTIMIVWGIITACMATIQSQSTYYVLRFLLGAIEAGLWPGMAFVMSRFYKRSETGARMGLYFLSGGLASMFSAFFSYAFQLIDSQHGLFGFQWLFLVFGVITVASGIITFVILPSTPYEKKGWLTEEEMQVQRHRMMRDADENRSGEQKITVRAFLKELIDYKLYLFTVVYLCTIMVTTSMQYYAQLIVLQMGYTSLKAALMSIPSSGTVCISCLIVTRFSDYFRSRSIPFMTFSMICGAGFAILAFAPIPTVRYAGLLITCLGLGPGVPLTMSWIVNSKDGELSIAIATAIVSAIAQLGTVFSTFFLYAGWVADAPRYTGSNSVNIGLAGLACITALILRLELMRLNRIIDRNGQTSDGRTRKFLL
ncbi:hypothetical protein Unana1_06189 [Umbelopsis nana]